MPENDCFSMRIAKVGLRKMNLVIQKDNAVANTYSVNKDYTSWRPLSKKITGLSKKITIVENNQHNQGLEGGNAIIQKDNGQKFVIQKDNNRYLKRYPQKKKEKNYCPNSHELRTAELLLSLIKQRNPNFKLPNLQRWASHIDRMLRLDNRSAEDIEKVVRWCQANQFWQNNVLSTAKLREQFDKLYMKMSADGNGTHTPQRHRGLVL